MMIITTKWKIRHIDNKTNTKIIAFQEIAIINIVSVLIALTQTNIIKAILKTINKTITKIINRYLYFNMIASLTIIIRIIKTRNQYVKIVYWKAVYKILRYTIIIRVNKWVKSRQIVYVFLRIVTILILICYKIQRKI